jgi:hypothetical protein
VTEIIKYTIIIKYRSSSRIPIRENPPLSIPNLRRIRQQILRQSLQRFNLTVLILDIWNKEVRDKETEEHECGEADIVVNLAVLEDRREVRK